jgi:hypothetical protein
MLADKRRWESSMRGKGYALTLAPVLFLISVGGATAQQAADQAPLPPICVAAGADSMVMGGMAPPSGSTSGGKAMPMDAAHEAMMAGMDKMQTNMMVGMAAPDIDVAFVCGMIPHHQGAIAMARAELQYGKDPQNRRLARSIIAAQEKEVTEMLAWLKARAK